jgi:cell division cycle 2-like
VDVWSIACIIAEFLRVGVPLFQGNSELHQFQVICETIGYPTKDDWP